MDRLDNARSPVETLNPRAALAFYEQKVTAQPESTREGAPSSASPTPSAQSRITPASSHWNEPRPLTQNVLRNIPRMRLRGAIKRSV